MRGREFTAWLVLSVIAFIAWWYWPTVKTAWKYREQLGQANDVLDGLGQIGALK
jgi:hypothetical protein